MDALRANPAYATALQYAQPSALLQDFRNGIAIGNTTFIEARSTAGLPVRIPTGEAYLVPQGIADLLLTNNTKDVKLNLSVGTTGAESVTDLADDAFN